MAAVLDSGAADHAIGEIETFLLVCDYLAATPYADVTGGSSRSGAVGTRRRCGTGLQRKGWLAFRGDPGESGAGVAVPVTTRLSQPMQIAGL